MNQVNSTDAVVLKSSCSCGRFPRIADIKNLKRPQISPWVLPDVSRRCGRYGHITRICCIGGNTCVFSHMCIRIGKRPQRPHVRKSVLSEHEQLVLTMWAVGVGGRCGRTSLDATADKPILYRNSEFTVLRPLYRQDLQRINPTETTTCTQVAPSYGCGSNANEQHDAIQARQWRFGESATVARREDQRRLLRGSSAAREAFNGLTEMPP